MNLLVKILVMTASSTSIGFGIWHFFVPKAWNWYSYIDINATELVAAIRAINAFFSLSLVLFGLVNILLIHGDRSNRYSIMVMLAATCILWLTRVAFQLIYPQGSLYAGLQYGMLSAFVIVFLCYLISLISTLTKCPKISAIPNMKLAKEGKARARSSSKSVTGKVTDLDKQSKSKIRFDGNQT